MIHVVAIINAKPGQRRELLAALNANLDTVRAEHGCLEYGPAIDAETSPAQFGPDSLVVIEKWSTQDALAAHAAAPHMAAFAAATRHLVAGRSIHVLNPA